jgi:hypothetical protein
MRPVSTDRMEEADEWTRTDRNRWPVADGVNSPSSAGHDGQAISQRVQTAPTAASNWLARTGGP